MTHDYIDRDAIPYVAANDGTVYVAFKEYVDKIPAADVVSKSEYARLEGQLAQSQMESLHLREDYGDLMVRYLVAETETAKKIFDDTRNLFSRLLNGDIKCQEFNVEFLELMKKYKVED